MPSNLPPTELSEHYLASPIGWLRLEASATHLLALDFIEHTPAQVPPTAHPVLHAAEQQLNQYFAGARTTFDLPLLPQGTAFQQSVWQALLAIPYGQLCSYLDIANAINNPKSVRAVGAANGRNPIPVIIPCHRVIGKNGTLIGFTGGLEKKEWLLKHEGSLLI